MVLDILGMWIKYLCIFLIEKEKKTLCKENDIILYGILGRLKKFDCVRLFFCGI